MGSCDALGYEQWPTLFLYYKLDIFTLFHKVHYDDLPELLYKDIYIKRSMVIMILYGEKTTYSYPDLTLDIGRTRSRIEDLCYGTLLVLMNMEFHS